MASISERDRLRAKDPALTQWVDDMRQVFGDVRVRYLRFADGEEVGTPPERGFQWTTGREVIELMDEQRERMREKADEKREKKREGKRR